MTYLMASSIKEKLWHKMRADLAQYVPELYSNQLLMCCCCGRFLSQNDFSLEHLIPQQVLKRDPAVVRKDPAMPANTRAGILLLCKAPLKNRGNTVYGSGCNSWKGRFYDRPIRDLVSEKALGPSAPTQVHIIAAICLAYLAMAAEFGYRVVLVPSGALMRRQFFSPDRFHRDLPAMSQILGGSMPVSPNAPMWTRPFAFRSDDGKCYVVSRNFAVILPLSQNPRQPIASHLRIAPPNTSFARTSARYLGSK